MILARAQDDPARQARELIEKLRSQNVQERDDASRKLKDLGKSAVPALEKALMASDSEVAARARQLLRVLSVQEQITTNLRKTLPELVDRIAEGNEHTWTDAFYEARRNPSLKKEDVESLTCPALRGVGSDDELLGFCRVMVESDYRSVIPELLRLIQRGGYLVPEKVILPPFMLNDVIHGGDGLISQVVTRTLVEMKAKEAIPELVNLLKNEAPYSRYIASNLLGALNATEAIPEILKQLKDDRVALRASAASTLGKLRAPEAKEALAALLRENEPGIRLSGLVGIRELGAKEAVPDLIPLLKDGDLTVRSWTLSVLRDLHAKASSSDILPLLRDEDYWLRKHAADALVAFRARGLIPRVLPLLKDKDPDVRVAAIWTLEGLGARESVAEIAVCLERDDPRERWTAAHALGRIGSKKDVPALIKRCKDPNPGVRARAAEALGELGAIEALPSLNKLSGDSNSFVRTKCAQALGKLGVEEAIPTLWPLLGDSDVVREGAKDIIGSLDGYPNPLGPHWRIFESESFPVDYQAAESLCLLGGKKGIEFTVNHSGTGTHSVLNARRKPDMWKTLSEKRVLDDPPASEREMLEFVAKLAGLELDARGFTPVPGGPLCDGVYRFRPPGYARPILEWLYAITRHCWCEFILEDGCIRIVSTIEAEHFWQRWYKAEQGKK